VLSAGRDTRIFVQISSSIAVKVLFAIYSNISNSKELLLFYSDFLQDVFRFEPTKPSLAPPMPADEFLRRQGGHFSIRAARPRQSPIMAVLEIHLAVIQARRGYLPFAMPGYGNGVGGAQGQAQDQFDMG